ncbi:Sulfite exporter TauE/SafE [Roseibium album]|nr:Sulfite exporter TauE/SafE [Roseibium album]
MTDLSAVDTSLILISILVFTSAGVVKGLVGFGLPTICLGLMTVFVGVEKAMVLILWPTFLTNLWQALSGEHLKALFARLWPFLFAAVATLAAGTFVLTQIAEGAADLILGALMVAYAVSMLRGVVFYIPKTRIVPVGIAAGLLNGVFSGLTGSYSVPGVMYLQALGLQRDELIQAMGLLFLFSTVALAASLGSFGLMGGREALASLALVGPALSGVWVGQWARQRASENTFRRLILSAILLLGLYLIPLGLWRLW